MYLINLWPIYRTWPLISAVVRNSTMEAKGVWTRSFFMLVVVMMILTSGEVQADIESCRENCLKKCKSSSKEECFATCWLICHPPGPGSHQRGRQKNSFNKINSWKGNWVVCFLLKWYLKNNPIVTWFSNKIQVCLWY